MQNSLPSQFVYRQHSVVLHCAHCDVRRSPCAELHSLFSLVFSPGSSYSRPFPPPWQLNRCPVPRRKPCSQPPTQPTPTPWNSSSVSKNTISPSTASSRQNSVASSWSITTALWRAPSKAKPVSVRITEASTSYSFPSPKPLPSSKSQNAAKTEATSTASPAC